MEYYLLNPRQAPEPPTVLEGALFHDSVAEYFNPRINDKPAEFSSCPHAYLSHVEFLWGQGGAGAPVKQFSNDSFRDQSDYFVKSLLDLYVPVLPMHPPPRFSDSYDASLRQRPHHPPHIQSSYPPRPAPGIANYNQHYYPPSVPPSAQYPTAPPRTNTTPAHTTSPTAQKRKRAEDPRGNQTGDSDAKKTRPAPNSQNHAIQRAGTPLPRTSRAPILPPLFQHQPGTPYPNPYIAHSQPRNESLTLPPLRTLAPRQPNPQPVPQTSPNDGQHSAPATPIITGAPTFTLEPVPPQKNKRKRKPAVGKQAADAASSPKQKRPAAKKPKRPRAAPSAQKKSLAPDEGKGKNPNSSRPGSPKTPQTPSKEGPSEKQPEEHSEEQNEEQNHENSEGKNEEPNEAQDQERDEAQTEEPSDPAAAAVKRPTLPGIRELDISEWINPDYLPDCGLDSATSPITGGFPLLPRPVPSLDLYKHVQLPRMAQHPTPEDEEWSAGLDLLLQQTEAATAPAAENPPCDEGEPAHEEDADHALFGGSLESAGYGDSVAEQAHETGNQRQEEGGFINYGTVDPRDLYASATFEGARGEQTHGGDEPQGDTVQEASEPTAGEHMTPSLPSPLFDSFNDGSTDPILYDGDW